MSEFTPGKWWVAPPVFDGDAIFAPPQEKGRRNEVVAMGILNNADARLIASAPEMYDELYEALQLIAGTSAYDGDAYSSQAKSIRELLARIDGGRRHNDRCPYV